MCLQCCFTIRCTSAFCCCVEPILALIAVFVYVGKDMLPPPDVGVATTSRFNFDSIRFRRNRELSGKASEWRADRLKVTKTQPLN